MLYHGGVAALPPREASCGFARLLRPGSQAVRRRRGQLPQKNGEDKGEVETEIGKVCVFLSGVALTAFSAPHVLEPKTMAHCPEEGLLIGNGDLSCSVYRESNRVVFRLGKGDVWDRWLDLSRDARPATIREIRRGVLDEGWKVNPYDGKGTVATKGTKVEKRMREICNGNGRGTQEHPFPEPKPTGELRLFLPGDWGEPEVVQRLTVEEARLQIGFRWRNGMTADVEAVIPPRANVLSLAWRLDAITPKDAEVWHNAFRHSSPLSLGYGRHADPRPDVWRAKEAAVQVGTWCPSGGEWDVTNSPPLPPPVATLAKEGAEWVEQSFYPDLLFPDGFKVRLTGRASASRGAMRPRALDDDAWICTCWEADATFENWRAQGAFLVSASRIKGHIRGVTVTSEKGEDCLVHGAWTVTDAEGRRVATDRDEFGRLRFKTSVGGRYVLDGPPAGGDGK